MVNTRQRKAKQGTAGASAGWTVRLLGDPALIGPDGRAHALERRAAALFALSALEPGISRARAATLLWPDAEEAHARQALRQQLLRLKKLADRPLIVGESALALESEVGVDVRQPDASGVLLGDFIYDDSEALATWVEQRRVERRRGETADLGQLLAEAEAGGDLQAALRFGEQLVAAEPTSEAHHRTLMRLHYQRGDVAQAQAAYERLRTTLAREFGVTPSPETQLLSRTIREARIPPPPSPPTAASPPPSLLRPPRMIGRERELQAVADAVASGRNVVVFGEAGLGKTRLLEEFSAARAATIRVRARPGDAKVPYALLARLLRTLREAGLAPESESGANVLASIVPEFGVAPARVEPLRLERAVEQFLGSAAQRMIDGLIVDDVHFADEASMELLARVACGSGTPRLVLGCRPLEAESVLAPLRGALESQMLAELQLPPLEQPQVAELLLSLQLAPIDAGELAEPLTRHTGGNPLFVLETLKQWLQQGRSPGSRGLPRPVSVGALIERRLKTLSAAALGLARVAAVAGGDFSTELAEQVLGVRALALADAWAELESAQVLRGAAFAHDLVYEAVCRSLPAPIAAHTHRAVAAHLEAHGGEPARIAEHWLAGEEPGKAVAPLRAAAVRAAAAGRPREAAHLYRRAAELLEQRGELTAAFDCVNEESTLLSLAANAEALVPVVDHMRRLAQSGAERARAEFVAARILELRGERDAYARQIDTTLTLAVACGADDVEASCRMSLAAVAFFAGRYELAAQHMASAVRVFQSSGDAAGEAAARSSLGVALGMLGRTGDSLRELEGAAPLLLETKNTAYLMANLSSRAVTHIDTGDLKAALGLLAQARLMQRDADVEPGARLLVARNLISALRLSGDYRAALDVMQQAEGEFRGEPNLYAGSLALVLAQLFIDLGRADLARARLHDFERRDNTLDRDRFHAASVRARLNEVIEGHAVGVVSIDGVEEPALRCAIALYLSGADAAAARRRLLDEARRCGLHGHAAALAARCAEDALAGGDQNAARTAVEAATQALASHDSAHYLPAIWLRLHRSCAALGQVDEAHAALSRGVEWVQRMASDRMPQEFRDSFLNRNQVNRTLLTAATRTRRTIASPS